MGGGSKAVNAVGSCEGGSPDEQCFQMYDEEASYINNQREGSRPNYQGPNQGSWRQGQGNQGWIKGNQQNSSQPPTSDFANSKIKDMLSRVLKKVESTDTFCKEMRDEVKSIGQYLSSHSTSIKQLVSQLGQISAILNQRQKGTLPSDTVANPKNDGDHKCNVITTRSGQIIGEEALVKDDDKMVEEPIIVEKEVTPKKKRASIEKPIVVEDCSEIDDASKGKEAVEEVPRASPPVLKPPPPFPQRLAKKADDGKFLKFIERLKGISINIPLVEALEQMPDYAKFMKDLVTKKRHASFEIMGVTYHCSSIVTKALVQKKEDLGAFTIPYTIGMYKSFKALCDLGASINLMSLAIFKKLGLDTPQPTTMRLLMADRTVTRPVGILYDVLMRVDRFIFSADFVILDCEVDFEVPIILGRPFLATGRALVDVESGDLKFRMSDEEVTFHICKSMKQSADMSVMSIIDTIDEAMDTTVEHEHVGDMLAEVIMNYEREDEEDIEETVNTLIGLGSYYYNPKKLDLDLENRETPIAKPSIIEPPTLELKPLPSHLGHEFFGPKNTLPVIISTRLTDEQRESVEHQGRLNPPMQEVVKIEIIKWLDDGVVYPISNSSWLPPPISIKGVRSFLGQASFYRTFIKDFSKIANPLCKLLEKESKFVFDDCLKAFEGLKERLTSAPIIIAPDWSQPFELMCDASGFSIGVVLGQKRDKNFHPIYYASKTLNGAKMNYTVTEKELLAIVFAFEKFRAYLLGTHVIFHTDQLSLRYLMTKKDAKPKLIRWVIPLQEFGFKVKDRKGCEN
ncbi:uncharacterized protein LOC132637788 [Lycium barbarum]|uniref:uncharacterized protein LOC132637788 n=1 Tax=Lycium barbarum TaxID=112863 RepID=UPI00293E06B8|nr:uncharacterized protein LOC132637788 [Lycium barbarum]